MNIQIAHNYPRLVNVGAYPYSAVGDGVTDSSVIFQNALNDVSLQGGGGIFVPTGTFLLRNILVPSNVYIQGNGTANSILMQLPNPGKWESILYIGAPSLAIQVAQTNTNNNIRNIVIRDIQFRSRCDTEGFLEQCNQVCIVGGSDVTFNNVLFKGAKSDGIYLGDNTWSYFSTMAFERHNSNVRVINCSFDGINQQNRNGISVTDGLDILIDNCTFVNFTSSTMPAAIDIEPNGNGYEIIKRISIKNCNISNCGGGGIFFYLTAMTSDLPSQIGDYLIENNVITNFTGPGNAVAGIMITHPRFATITDSSTSTNAVVRNNTISGGLKWGLNCGGNKDSSFIGNTITDCAQGNILGFDSTSHGSYRTYFQNNVISNPTVTMANAGLYIPNFTKGAIIGNTFNNCGNYWNLPSSIYVPANTNVSNTTISDNTFSCTNGQTLTPVLTGSGATCTGAANAWLRNTVSFTPTQVNNFKAAISDDVNVTAS